MAASVKGASEVALPCPRVVACAGGRGDDRSARALPVLVDLVVGDAGFGGHARRERIWETARVGDLARCAGDLATTVARADLAALADAADELVLLPALAETAEMASYRGEPDHLDRALTDRRVREALLPIAGVVAASPTAR